MTKQTTNSDEMEMHNPPHPGRMIKHMLIEDEDGIPILPIREAADIIGFTSEEELRLVVNEDCAVCGELAHRLEMSGFGSAKHWVDMQIAWSKFNLVQ